MKNKLATKIIFTVLLGLVVTGAAYYFMLPAINVHSTGFWTFLMIPVLCFTLPFLFKKVK